MGSLYSLVGGRIVINIPPATLPITAKIIKITTQSNKTLRYTDRLQSVVDRFLGMIIIVA